MSMRATFTTEFIYDGVEGNIERYTKMCEALGVKPKEGYRHMIGQISGITSGSDLGESDIKRWIEEMCYEVEKLAIVEFSIVWLLESGDIIIKHIFAHNPDKEKILEAKLK